MQAATLVAEVVLPVLTGGQSLALRPPTPTNSAGISDVVGHGRRLSGVAEVTCVRKPVFMMSVAAARR